MVGKAEGKNPWWPKGNGKELTAKQLRILREMDRLWQEAKEKVSKEEWVKRRLGWEDWEGLMAEAVLVAKRELGRRRWRGARQGVVPRGYDAEAIASEAVMEMLEGKGRLVAGWTRERLMKELERMISGKVRLLHSLKETRAMRNEWVVPAHAAQGAPAVSILRWVPGDGPNGYDAAVEGEEGQESLRAWVESHLEDEPDLKAVFGCLCEGVRGTREIAARLGKTEREIWLARRRLTTRLNRLRGEKQEH